MTWGWRLAQVSLVLAFGMLWAVAFAGASQAGGGADETIGILGLHNRWHGDGAPVSTGGLNYPSDIYTVDVASGRVRNLTHDERSEYCWSWLRHGRGILFSSVPSDDMNPGRTFIDVVSASGGQRQRLVSLRLPGGDYVCPTLSPDGERVLYIVDSGRRRGLYVMRIDGSHSKRLTRPLEREDDASWSPDGRRILFVREFGAARGSGKGHIYVINADGSGLRQLTTRTSRFDSEAVWSPDGKQIAFTREIGYGSARTFILTMRSDGTDIKWLTRRGSPRDQGSPGNPVWMSTDRLIYQDARRHYAWQTVAADGSTAPRPLPPHTRIRIGRLWWNRSNPLRASVLDPAIFSPDGRWVAQSKPGAVTSSYWVSRTLWVAHADGTDRHLVARFHCCHTLDFDWAPE